MEFYVSSKYLGDFWRSLEMPLINYKAELKLKGTQHCVLAIGSNDNDDANSNNIIVTIYPVVTLSAKDNQKLSK